jgi:hypothetical protein
MYAADTAQDTVLVETFIPDSDESDEEEEDGKENPTEHGHPPVLENLWTSDDTAKSDAPAAACKTDHTDSNKTTDNSKPPLTPGNTEPHRFLHDIKAAMSKIFETDSVLVAGQQNTFEVYKHPSHYFTKTKKAYAAYNYLNKKKNVQVDWKVFSKVVRNCINNNRRKVLGTATDLDAPKVFNGKKDETGNKAKPQLPPSVKNVTVTKSSPPAGAGTTALVSPPNSNSEEVYEQSTQLDSGNSTESAPSTAATVAANAVREAGQKSPPKAKVRLVCVFLVV